MKLAATAAFGLSPTLRRPVSSRFPSPLPLHLRAAAWTLATAVCSLFYVGPAMLLLPPFLALWSPRAAAALLLVDLALAFAPAREWAGFRSVFQLWCGAVSRRLTRLNATSFGGQAVTNSCASRVPRYEIFDVRTNLPQDGARAVGATLRAHCVLRRVFASLTHSEVLCARARACLRASRAPPLTRRSRRPLSPSAPPPPALPLTLPPSLPSPAARAHGAAVHPRDVAARRDPVPGVHLARALRPVHARDVRLRRDDRLRAARAAAAAGPQFVPLAHVPNLLPCL